MPTQQGSGEELSAAALAHGAYPPLPPPPRSRERGLGAGGRGSFWECVCWRGMCRIPAVRGPMWGGRVTLMETDWGLLRAGGVCRKGGRAACSVIAEPYPGPPSCVPPTCPPHQAVTRPTLPDPHLSHPQPPKCLEPPSHPEEPSDLEELEQFARTFKQRRIKLGFTQVWGQQRKGWRVEGCGGDVGVWEDRALGRTEPASRRGEPEPEGPTLTATLPARWPRVMWAWPWASSTATTSARPPSPASRPSI